MVIEFSINLCLVSKSNWFVDKRIAVDSKIILKTLLIEKPKIEEIHISI